ncbi:hypothetical protein HED48_07655 [Ochrobactrum intermedium]|nr:hypothetical protein [Brucella intermedia]
MSIQKGASRAQDFALQLRRFDKVTGQRDREAVLRAAFLKSTGEPKSGSYVCSAAVKKNFCRISRRISTRRRRVSNRGSTG